MQTVELHNSVNPSDDDIAPSKPPKGGKSASRTKSKNIVEVIELWVYSNFCCFYFILIYLPF